MRLRERVAGLVPLMLLATAAVVAAPAPALAAAPVVDVRAGAAGRDYATEVLGDAWDYSQPGDIVLDQPGPGYGLQGAGVADGTLRFDVSSPAYVSPLWPGYQGALLLGQDGAAEGNALDTGRYDRVAVRVYASSTASAGLFWFNCPGGGVAASCGGGLPFELAAGWNTYLLTPGASVYGGWPLSWSGTLSGLRVAVTPQRPTHVEVDWMRVVAAGTGASVTYANPASGQRADLLWREADATDRTGVLGSTTTPSGAADASVLPPGRYQFAVRSRGAVGEWSAATGLRSPLPVITAPDELGVGDYARDVTGNPWDMADPADVSELGGARDVTWSGSYLAATNASNDPYAWLRVPAQGIDGREYHRLTLTTSYDGPFDLEDVAGGGTMGRVVWRRPDVSGVMQTADIVTYTGERTVTVDLSAPTAQLNEEDAPNKLPFVSSSPVTGLRWDPNEDRGARRWYLLDATLRRDWMAHQAFAVRWYLEQQSPGTRVTVVADTDRRGCDGRTVVADQLAVTGANESVWETGGVPAGRYWICVRAVDGSAVTERYAGGPLVVQGGTVGSVPAAPAAPSVTALVGSAAVQWDPPASPGSALVGYQVREAGSGRVVTLGALSPGTTVEGLSAGTGVSFSVRAVNDAGWGPWSAGSVPVTVRTTDAAGFTFVPATPVRVLSTDLSGGQTTRLQLAGRFGVPADARAVVLNVTSTRVQGGGFVSVTPAGGVGASTTSNLNTAPGQDIPNGVVVRLGQDGSVDLRNSSGRVGVLADLQGWLVDSGGLEYHATSPVRVVDSRDGTGGLVGRLGPGDRRSVSLAAPAVPAGSRAAVLNLTAAATSGQGFVSAVPRGATDVAGSSALNTSAGRDVANLGTVQLVAPADLDLYNASGSTHLVADVQGTWSTTPGWTYRPLQPWRITDTRTGLGAVPRSLTGGQVVRVQVAGAPGSGVPASARAVVLNLTAVGVQGSTSFLSVTPADAGGRSATSNLNVRGGDTRPNLVYARLSDDGAVDVFLSQGSADVLVDVSGWFG